MSNVSKEPAAASSNTSDGTGDALLRCTLTGRELTPDEAYWAPPLITLGYLFKTLFDTALHAPANLGHVLMGQQPDVPYAPEAREQLAKRRSAEQIKMLLLLLVILVLIAIPIMLALR